MVDWLQCGDGNTKFFHLSTLIQKRKNQIEVLQAKDGGWVTDQGRLKNMVLDYYRSLYRADLGAVVSSKQGVSLGCQKRSNTL